MTSSQSAAVMDAARDLQIWGYPLIFAQRLRLRFTCPLDPRTPRPPTSAGAPLNELGHQRRLSDHTLTAGVAPNVDTLYSLAFLDLDSGDFELRMPDFGSRYYSVQIGEADSSTAAVVGCRTHGATLPPLLLTRGAGRSEVDDRVECRSRYVMVAIRILVDPGMSGDLLAAQRIQDLIELTGPPSPATPSAPGTVALVNRGRDDEVRTPEGFLESLDTAMAGLSTADIPSWVVEARLRLRKWLADDESGGGSNMVAQGLATGLDRIAQHVSVLGRTVNGWAINDGGTDFGDDHLLRAAVAYSQIYINPAAEAVYPVCETDHLGRSLTGAHNYSITFASDDLPPADHFWSLTMYHRRGLLCENVIGRHAITDRTPGLEVNDDGTLALLLQHARPSSGANWLPCPPDEFRVMLRLYGPRDPSWSPPAIVRVG
ncbi:DUF1214 domain-containing protein [Gordonia McavH-238-E]|uniref:DUF1214 domain-containing protein n=1 Tax=Gordonia sp. McavH-238-E TaxID=2917736 RepID=UPI001EF53F0D|nr:DUF1214 domain-containing protein [Gordonia sp. McavH-238-E]MCG7634961.1 DUF1214 domain-containing protein [Gordonia sp. McavH-238-E]